MKNKKSNLIKYIILAITFVILIFLLIFLVRKKNNTTIQKIGESGFSLNITNSISVDTSKTISSEPNTPQIGAGMIPVKCVDGVWQITTTDDTEWYDYSAGKFATIMLSNGKYVSEERYNMGEHQLIPQDKNNLPQVSQTDLGTIFVWIPRLVYTDSEIIYLNGTSIVETEKFSLPESFTYKLKTSSEYALSGIWVEQNPLDTKALVTSEISVMNKEDNDYGLIGNEKVEITDKYANKLIDRVQDGIAASEQQIKNISNTNRIMLRIVNTNVNTPIIAYTYTAEKIAHIEVTYSENPIREIISIDNEIVLSEYSKTATMPAPDNGEYLFAIVDTVGNVRVETVNVGDGTPELLGFKVNTTFLVMYDSNENEYSSTLLKDVLKDGYQVNSNNGLIKGKLDFKKIAQIEKENKAIWYNYEEQKWANIVVRNNGNIAYFTWIPRYVYKLNNTEQSTDVIFVNTDNEDADGNTVDSSYILPDAFTWINEDGETVQISGYWTGKYAASNAITFNLTAEVIGGMNEIKINNISSNLSNVVYDLYLYNSSDTEEGNEVQFAQNKTTHIFKKVPAGDYKLKVNLTDTNGVYRAEKWFDVSVIDAGIPENPDFAGYKVDTTYLVVYAEDGTKDESIPISRILSDNYQLLNETARTLKVGNVDLSKVESCLAELKDSTGKDFVWYDYEEQKWANIVTKNNSKTAYFVWIPRYAYKLNNTDQSTEILFLSPNDAVPDGWILPDAFIWDSKPINGYWIGKYAVSY